MTDHYLIRRVLSPSGWRYLCRCKFEAHASTRVEASDLFIAHLEEHTDESRPA